uniref:Putative ovule protein n=1 Tax=Solanum chacoense TaxID=4108 RepID=A0A0V0HPV2_SOLCH
MIIINFFFSFMNNATTTFSRSFGPTETIAFVVHHSPPFYHVDIDASMVRKRIVVDIRCNSLKRDYFLVNQILNHVLQVDTVFGIMSNTVGMIHIFGLVCKT